MPLYPAHIEEHSHCGGGVIGSYYVTKSESFTRFLGSRSRQGRLRNACTSALRLTSKPARELIPQCTNDSIDHLKFPLKTYIQHAFHCTSSLASRHTRLSQSYSEAVFEGCNNQISHTGLRSSPIEMSMLAGRRQLQFV